MLCAPLHELITKNTTWTWDAAKNEAFEQIKRRISSDNILVHFDPSKQIILSCDASSYGIRAILQHRINGILRPIAAASRTLTKPNQNYSNTGKESLLVNILSYKAIIRH